MAFSRDVTLIMVARILRSLATGAMGVVISLYLYNVLHLSFTLIGIFFAAGAFSAPLMSLYFGRLGDEYDRKLVLIITMSMLPASIAIITFTKYYPLLVLAALLGNIGTAGVLASGSMGAVAAPLMTAILADKTSGADRTRVYSMLNLASGIAGAVGALLSHLSYVQVFEISLGLSAMSVLAVLPISSDHRPDPAVKAKPARRGGLGLAALSENDRRVIKIFSLTGALNGAAQGLVTPFLPLVFEVLYHASKGAVGNIFFLGGLAAALISLATPVFTERWGFVKTVVVTRSISTAALVLIPFMAYIMGNVPYVIFIAVPIYLIYVMFRIVSLPAQQALMMSIVSARARSTTAGVNQAARLLPSASATMASGVMLDYLPIPAPFIAALILNIVNIHVYRKYLTPYDVKGRVVAAVD